MVGCDGNALCIELFAGESVRVVGSIPGPGNGPLRRVRCLQSGEESLLFSSKGVVVYPGVRFVLRKGLDYRVLLPKSVAINVTSRAL